MFLRCSQDPGTLLAHFECQNIHSLKNIGGATYCMSIVFPRVHPIVLLKRASRSLTKTGFFYGFSLRFPLFLAREGLQVEVYVGPMLELVLGGVLEASWSDLGRFFGGHDGAKLAQDGGKTAQDGAKTAQDGAKMPPRRPRMPPRRPKTAPGLRSRRAKMLPRRAKIRLRRSQDAPKCDFGSIWDGYLKENSDVYIQRSIFQKTF